jgi:hypothetical protein
LPANGHRKSLDALLLALASGKSYRDAAAEVGVSVKTVQRRMSDAAFRARVSELRGAMVSEASGRLARAMSGAAGALEGLLTAEGESVRLSAARSVLEFGVKIRESAELEQRVVALEQSLSQRKRKEP